MIKASQSMPSDAGSIYVQTLEQIDSQSKSQVQLARKVLCWLVLAKASLTVPELLEAIAIEPDTTKMDPLNRRSAAIVIRVCKGLVVIDKNSQIVRLAHFTLQEFLAAQITELTSMKLEISKACITYLSYEIFAGKQFQSIHDYDKILRKHPFCFYAGTHLSEHLQDSGCMAPLLDMLLTFVTSRSISEKYVQLMFGHPWPFPSKFSSLHVAAAIGSAEVTRQVLKSDPSLLNAEDSVRRTPILWAIESNHGSVVRVLLEEGANLKSEYESVLNCAARNRHDHLVKSVLQESMKMKNGHFDAECELFVAAIISNKTRTNELLRMGVATDFRDMDSGTALQWAAWYGHFHVAALLLEAGVDVHTSDCNGREALHEAAERGHLKVAELLLFKGAQVNAVDKFTMTPLHRAAVTGVLGLLSLLLDHGADINAKTRSGETALDFAMESGWIEAVDLLVKKGANVLKVVDLEYFMSTVREELTEAISDGLS